MEKTTTISKDRKMFLDFLVQKEKIQKQQCEILEARGLKVIGTGADWIDWERSDGLQYRSWDFEWLRYIPVFDRQGNSAPHNCMQHCFCEICGLDCSE